MLSTLEPESAFIAFSLNLTFELAPLQQGCVPLAARTVLCAAGPQECQWWHFHLPRRVAVRLDQRHYRCSVMGRHAVLPAVRRPRCGVPVAWRLPVHHAPRHKAIHRPRAVLPRPRASEGAEGRRAEAVRFSISLYYIMNFCKNALDSKSSVAMRDI